MRTALMIRSNTGDLFRPITMQTTLMSADESLQGVQMLAPFGPPVRLGSVVRLVMAIAAVDDKVVQRVVSIVAVLMVNFPPCTALAAALAYIALTIQRLQP